MIDDYNVYKYTTMEWLGYFIKGMCIGAALGVLFYSNVIGVILLSAYGFLYTRNMKKQLVDERKWLLNLQFKDGLISLSAALNAGYSIENSFKQAIIDLKLIYPINSYIIVEFDRMVKQIEMNRNIEEVLKEFGDRTGIDDIINFAEVLDTAKRTGGDVIKIIRQSEKMIGDKVEVKREILTNITAKKFESKIMSLIPFCIILYLRIFSPGYLDPLYHNLFGFLFMSILLIIYYFVQLMAKKIMDIEI